MPIPTAEPSSSADAPPLRRGASRLQSWPRWFLLGLACLFIALSVQYSVKAYGAGARSNRSAILRWRQQLQHLADEDIYQRYTYPNPPIMALFLEPLAEMPPLVGSLFWFFLKLALTGIALLWVFRMVAEADEPFPPWAKALTIVLSLRPVMGDLSHGNINLFILFLVVAALYAYHRSRDFLSGTILALAIACKVTPLLFVPYFLWKRTWKTLAGCAVGLALFFVVVPGWFLGAERNWELVGSWVQQMVTPYVVAGTVTSDHPNQSLPGLVFRLATHSPSFLDERGGPLRYDNFVTIDARAAGWLIKGCMAVFAGLVIWCCRTRTVPRRGWRLCAEFSLVVLGMLLFSERTWKHHCVTLLLPFAVLSYYLATARPGRALRAYVVGSLATALLLMASTSTTGLFDGLDEMAKRAQVYGAYVWAYLVLVVALIVILRRGRVSGQWSVASDQWSVASKEELAPSIVLSDH